MAVQDQENDYVLEGSDEAWRLAVMHQAYKEAQGGKLVLAPLDLTTPGLNILDSGTSDGTWLLDLHTQLSSSPSGSSNTYLGTDLSLERFPIQLPTNLTLARQDVRAAWPASLQSTFDLVHQRLVLAGCGGGTGIEDAVKRLCGLVKPGGWIQLCEGEQLVEGEDNGPAMRQFWALLTGLFAAWGFGWEYPEKLKGWVEEMGFVRVEDKVMPVELGRRNGNEALRAKTAVATVVAVKGLVGVAKSMPDFKALTHDELDSLPARLQAELDSRGAVYPMRFVWGQRPLS